MKTVKERKQTCDRRVVLSKASALNWAKSLSRFFTLVVINFSQMEHFFCLKEKSYGRIGLLVTEKCLYEMTV